MQGRVRALGLTGLERKVKEAIVAIQIEKRYTKREILTFYANQINLGHGAYGVEAASRAYFDKSGEGPDARRKPRPSPPSSRRRRGSARSSTPNARWRRRNNYVLPRMADEGFITEREAAKPPASLSS